MVILDGSADQRQRQRAVHRIQRQIQAGEFALAGQNGLEQLRPGIAGKERFELPAALPGHFHMAAHILAPLVVNADIAEAQGLAITGEAEGESREKGRVQADDPGDLLRVEVLRVKPAQSIKERLTGGIVISAPLLVIGGGQNWQPCCRWMLKNQKP